MENYKVEMESLALLKLILKAEAKIPPDLFRRTCFDTLLSKSWIKPIHRSAVERKLSAENDKEILASVIWKIEIGFWSPPSDSVDF